MTTWAQLATIEEHPQLIWDPDRWLLPVPLEGVMLVAVLTWVIPGAAWLLLGARRSLLLFVVLGFLWALGMAWVNWRMRLRRRQRLSTVLRPDSPVCANCLYAEIATR